MVGLGNPTDKYTRTRHNIGRRYIDHLLDQTKNHYSKIRQAEYFRLPDFFDVSLDAPLFCVRLESFMNESGPALKSIMEKNNISHEQVVVLVDDFMIPFGSTRIRPSGSSGGHNGLKSIIETFGTEEFPRMRIGIGPTPTGEDPADFVLKKFTKEEESKIPNLFEAVTAGLKILFQNGLEKAMNASNKTHF